MNRRKIYIDMDGVVADFNKFASDLIGREVGWEGKDLSDDEWGQLQAVENFYLKLPLIEESTKLVALAKSFSTRFDVEFLTAIPRVTTLATAGQDKIDWINKYYPGMKVNFGPYSRDKKNWAKPGYILIDDIYTSTKGLARELNIPIWSVSQVNRAGAKDDIKSLCEWLLQDEIPRLTKGDLTLKLESKWAEKIGTKYSVYVNSGSSAILLALAALKHTNRLKNNKIIVPGLSWATDVSSPMLLGMEPILCDSIAWKE